MTKPDTQKTKGMCIATRCTSVEQFIQMFHRFVDEESFFVSTLNTRPAGLETSFSVQLVDGTPVLRGLCVVLQAWTDSNNPFKTPGVRLGIKRMTANSMMVFEQLLITRSAGKPPPGTVTKPAPAIKVPAAPVPSTPAALGAAAIAALGTPAPVASTTTRPLPAATTLPATPSRPTGPTPGKAIAITPLRPIPTPVPTAAPAVVAKIPVPGSIPSAAPQVIAKTALTETAPAKSAPSRLVLEQPARAVSEPIPEHIVPEPTDVVEEKTDIREPRHPLGPTKPSDLVAKARPPAITPIGELTPPPPDETRTPGSDLVLPANPLMNLTDESLEGYVDCTLYEETGSFFPIDDASFIDDVVPPPVTPTPVALPTVSRTMTPTVPIADGPRERPSDLEPTPLPVPTMDLTPPPAIARSVTEPPPLTPPPPPPPGSARSEPVAAPPMVSAPAVADPPAPLVAAPSVPPPPSAPFTARLLGAVHKRQRWVLLGGVGVVAAAAVLVLVMTSGSSSGNASPAKPVAAPPAAKQVARLDVQPPVEKKPAPVAPTPDEESDESAPSEGGPPVVGAGPCKVVVATTPAGSTVELDGNAVGPSPLTVAATCDKHKLDISHARYQSATKLVTLTEGKPENVELTLTRPTHVVTVTSNPSGAMIFIDGRSAGTTPTKLSVLGFVTLKLEFKKTGYQQASTKLYSKVPQDTVSVRLTKW